MVCFRPLWMASVTPPDMMLTLLEGITTVIHYCLLDPSAQYHQVSLWKALAVCCLKDSGALDWETTSYSAEIYFWVLSFGTR